jgi:hypothetical protein
MPKTFQEIFPALEERLEQARQGDLPSGHAMELRRREKRQALGCPSDEEICGFVDGKLKAYSTQRWAEVGWHVHRCQLCQDDVEGLCEALARDLRAVAAATHQLTKRRLLRFVALTAAVAAVFVLAVLGVQSSRPMLAGGSKDMQSLSDVETPVKAPALVHRTQAMVPKERDPLDASPMDTKDTSTMKVSIPSTAGVSVSSVLRVAICSETELPTCGEGMVQMSVMEAACKVVGDENMCVAKSAGGGCAICLVLN